MARSRSPRKVLRRPASSQAPAASKRERVPKELDGLKALVVNLDRRPDRWARCEEMLKKETPWLDFERFSASDGTKMVIPESEVCTSWNTSRNANYSPDYDEWVYDAPGTELDGTHWTWPKEVPADDDKEWAFEKSEDGWAGVLTKKATKETWNLKLQFAERFRDPGQVVPMSGGERGCCHSHRRLWEVAAERKSPTLVLEDDVQFVFERSEPKLGMFNGKLLKQRLLMALKEAPKNFDVLYLGWAGHRGGNFLLKKGRAKVDNGKAIRKVEYVYTTVAYVISPKAAKQLLSISCPMDQPVDNFMAWEASQGRLKSYVILDKGDEDGLWAGGIVDQHDFVGDSDVKKSDGAAAHVFTPAGAGA